MPSDITGQIFGRWTVLAFAYTKPPHLYYRCRCTCGTERNVQGNSLLTGTSNSCGCLKRELSTQRATTHGGCGHPAYQNWMAMNRRCTNKGLRAYPRYGGRGIRVCQKWQTFEGFWADMEATWEPKLTIERNDNDGNYEPSNCRWATHAEQGRNKRNNVIIDTPWGRLTQSDAARKAGISLGALIHRMKMDWPKELWFTRSQRTSRN